MRDYNELLKYFNRRERRKQIKAFMVDVGWFIAFLVVFTILINLATK